MKSSFNRAGFIQLIRGAVPIMALSGIVMYAAHNYDTLLDDTVFAKKRATDVQSATVGHDSASAPTSAVTAPHP